MELIVLCTLVSVIGLLFVAYLAVNILKKDPGNSQMVQISEAIQEGAMAFLSREYKAIGIFIVVVFFALTWGINFLTALAYVIGAACSLSAGFIGMKIATKANSRTAQAATKGFNEAIAIAFSGGSVMGTYVVSIGLFAISILYLIFLKSTDIVQATDLIAGFSMGASSVALFARVGGGIYTKAADVGADLVGKVEAGIPEDDPRNPAVIADLVGDNVGDVAGMGADLYESYVGSIIAAIVIAVAFFSDSVAQMNAVVLIFVYAAIGIIASIFGTYFVKSGSNDPQKALRNGTYGAAAFLIIVSYLFTNYWYQDLTPFWCMLFGLVSGIIIGFTAEIYTSGKSVQKIAEAAQSGPATAIIAGFATGLKSALLPIIIIAIAIIGSYYLAGMFGIAIAALGMLAITGTTIAVDAYGPIADNSGGIAEMAHLGPSVRKITDKLDAAGNTTAAIGKGFAIGSAALTALALFTAYTQVAKMQSIDLMLPQVIAGLFIGGVIPFLFSAAAMQAVGRAAFSVVQEVRRQFKEIPGLMQGTAKADYAQCVGITTNAALKEMVMPGIMAVVIPLVIGIILGKEALAGFLGGSLISGVPLALLLANAGGAWDNAKKYVEEGNLGGKGTAVHAATVIGDTVGDPFKDTAGPALNILLKLMTIVSLVFAPLIISLNEGLMNLLSGLL